MKPFDEPLEQHKLILVELCLGASWDQPGNLFYGRFVELPRVGETVDIPHHHPRSFEVMYVRHRSATPAGDKAHVQLLLRAN